jgi:glycosyltransferase involved in cell wall biosynthesis
LVSDNASSDGSVRLVQALGDARIHLRVNHCNVGFAGNLDRAARMASGDRMIMLSSDDLMRPQALERYDSLYSALGAAGDRAVISSTWDVIDPDDKITSVQGPDRRLWTDADRAPELDAVAGGPVYRVAGIELLRRSLLLMRTPFNFAATCYPRSSYESIEGYGGGRLINPDKWFHWRLLSVVDHAYFIDASLFAYRWHPSNQTAIQAATGALKYVVDEYVSTLEMDAALLDRLGLTRETMVDAFVEHDIARHGLATLARGQRARARRILNFGKAVYPQTVRANRKAWALGCLLALGPIGNWAARRAYQSYLQSSAAPDNSAK